MTMNMREKNDIWSRVRPDLDVDDLIFNYETCHSQNGEESRTISER